MSREKYWFTNVVMGGGGSATKNWSSTEENAWWFFKIVQKQPCWHFSFTTGAMKGSFPCNITVKLVLTPLTSAACQHSYVIASWWDNWQHFEKQFRVWKYFCFNQHDPQISWAWIGPNPIHSLELNHHTFSGLWHNWFIDQSQKIIWIFYSWNVRVGNAHSELIISTFSQFIWCPPKCVLN